jgi:hypothetical protein
MLANMTTRLRLRLALSLVVLTAPPALAETANMADSFVDSIGVNTHLGSQASPYYTNFGAIVSAFQVSGIRHARDAFWFDWDSARGKSLISQVNDVKFLLTLGGNCNITRNNVHPENYLAWGFTTANIDAFEGMNEVSGCTDSNPPWYVNARNGQQYLWEAVKGNPQLAAIPVIGPSLYAAHETELRSDSAAIGDLTAYMNYGNEHAYSNDWKPSATFSWTPSAEAAMNGALPVWGTEAGYPQSYIPLDRANKYYSRLFFENFNHGIVRTYAYELMDEPQNSGGEGTFGLLNADGTAKPMFNTITNLITLLRDPGSAFTPGSLNYSFSGGPETLHHTLLQKRNGVFYLALWLELDWWNAASATITVNFSDVQGQIDQYDPLTSSNPKMSWSNVSSVELMVSDEATILAVSR